MQTKLFSPYQVSEKVTLKNRIVMAPMCMFSVANEDGVVTPFHITHYESRAIGQVGLIMIEATAVQPEGRIKTTDLGIWDDSQIKGLEQLNERIHAHGAKSSIQLAHAGRKAHTPDIKLAPSVIDGDEVQMSKLDITKTIQAFQQAAKRAKKAQFDIIEIHAAHGYLINQFLSPLTNKRQDEYGGDRNKRYRVLKEVIEAVQLEWNGPIFVRLSADEFHEQGNTMDDFIYFSQQLKELGVSLIDVSTGGIINAHIDVYPGYQLHHSEVIRTEAGIPTGAVGLITSPVQAEEILQNSRADLIFLGRVLLREPYWPKRAADELGASIATPKPYERGWKS